jgi:hypothetical protein
VKLSYFGEFASQNNFTNRLANERESYGKLFFFQLYISSFFCESIKKELHPMSCFEKIV